jgi:hypothetical protein
VLYKYLLIHSLIETLSQTHPNRPIRAIVETDFHFFGLLLCTAELVESNPRFAQLSEMSQNKRIQDANYTFVFTVD